jgi:hypothetical protein
VFVWLIGPLSPGLLTRIWITMFCAPCWIADARAAAACCVAASSWLPSAPPPCAPPFCVVAEPLAAAAWPCAAFVCVIAPLSPGLSTRLELTTFEGCCCTAFPPASAPWSVVALELLPAGAEGAADGSGEGLDPSARAFPAKTSAHSATAGMTSSQATRRTR